jgi:peptide deformylase
MDLVFACFLYMGDDIRNDTINYREVSMLKNRFETQEELDLYVAEEKVRKEKGYLSVSERKQLEQIIATPKLYIQKSEPKPAGLPIITNIDLLRKPCTAVEKGENVSKIIQDLKDTLANTGGIGLSANQIGINKRISYVKVPKFVNKNKEIQYNEYVLINAKIIEHDRAIRVNNEGCVSFHGVYINTRRYVFITVEYLNEKLEQQTGMFQDLDGLCVQHEIDHQNGITIFDRKWVA